MDDRQTRVHGLMDMNTRCRSACKIILICSGVWSLITADLSLIRVIKSRLPRLLFAPGRRLVLLWSACRLSRVTTDGRKIRLETGQSSSSSQTAERREVRCTPLHHPSVSLLCNHGLALHVATKTDTLGSISLLLSPQADKLQTHTHTGSDPQSSMTL